MMNMKGRMPVKELLYFFVELISKAHTYIMHLNDAFETNLTDKELHFLVIGLLGMAMIFVVFPIFSYLAKKGHMMTISWIYVFTVIVVITFAIEIGQKITGSGSMEFADIMYGLVGFLSMYVVFCLLRLLLRWLLRLIRGPKEEPGTEEP